MSNSLEEVIVTNPGGFVPAHPEREPWHKPTLTEVEIASTGIVAVVPLEVADRVHLTGLDWPSTVQNWDEPGDWMPITWGVT